MAAQYTNISDPSDFVGILLNIVTTDSLLPGDDACNHPDCTPSNTRLRAPALVVLKAFADSHILNYPIDFYSNESVRAPLNAQKTPSPLCKRACILYI